MQAAGPECWLSADRAATKTPYLDALGFDSTRQQDRTSSTPSSTTERSSVMQIPAPHWRTTRLIGEPGTGNTAIVEGLAQRIISGDAGAFFRTSDFVVSTSAHRCRTKYRGEL